MTNFSLQLNASLQQFIIIALIISWKVDTKILKEEIQVFDVCPKGTAAQGFQLKTEPYRGRWVDDTGVNGIRLFCGPPFSPKTVNITSNVGPWGKWGKIFECGQNGVIYAFKKLVDFSLKDNAGITNLGMYCTNNPPVQFIVGDGLSDGTWSKYDLTCDEGKVVCGLYTFVDPIKGPLLDDKSLYHVQLHCCTLA